MSLETRVALAGLLLLSAPCASAAAPSEGSASSSGDIQSLQAPFDRGEIPLDLDSMCSAEASLPTTRSAQLKQELARTLSPVLSSAGDPELRKRRGLHLSAQQLYERAEPGMGDLTRMKKEAGSSRPDQLLSLLYDLRGRVLTTAQLRDARAALADIQIAKGGKIELKLRTGPVDQDAYAMIAPSVAYELERAKTEGLDCTATTLYRFVSDPGRRAAPLTYGSIKHADLLKIYDGLEHRIETLTGQVKPGAGNGTPGKVDAGPIIASIEEIGGVYSKALKVLGDALELHAKYLSQRSGAPVAATLLRPGTGTGPKVQSDTGGASGTKVQTPAATGVSAASTPSDTATTPPASGGATSAQSPSPGAEAKAQPTASTEARAQPTASTEAKAQSPSPGAEAKAQPTASAEAKAQPTASTEAKAQPATTSAPAGATGVPAPTADGSKVAMVNRNANATGETLLSPELAAKKAALIGEVARQTQALRSQRTTDGRITTAPVGLANNLYNRMMRVYQIADMLVAPDNDSSTYRCAMSDDRIHITYTKDSGLLRHLVIEVEERIGKEVVMKWNLELDRLDDANYSMRGEFNTIKSSLTVEDANLTEYPNYQQLMVLMNRVNQILDNKI